MKVKSTYILKLLLLTGSYCLGVFARASTTNEVVEVPFDFYHHAIIVQGTIDGKGPFNMLLDTGVDPSVIDLNTAKGIDLKLAAVGEQGKGGGTETNLTYETRLPFLKLGGLAATDIRALAADLSKTSEALGKPIHGVLGYSLLKDRVVQIDYPKRVARFFPNSPFLKTAHRPNNSKLTTVSFHYRDDILVEEVSVNGKKVTANLDTGSSSSFQLTPAAVVALGLETQVGKAQVSESVGFNGLTENREGKIKNVTIGGISVDAPTVVFYGKGTGHDEETWGIRIGNAFLQDFVVTIDYQNEVITFEKP